MGNAADTTIVIENLPDHRITPPCGMLRRSAARWVLLRQAAYRPCKRPSVVRMRAQCSCGHVATRFLCRTCARSLQAGGRVGCLSCGREMRYSSTF
jgi:hypothetical protein